MSNFRGNFQSDPKNIVGDTQLFSAVSNRSISAKELNKNFDRIENLGIFKNEF